MTNDLFWIFAFNILINSVLAFVTATFFIKLLFFVLRIKQPRLRALFLTVPLFKVILDPFLYDFSNWALRFAINPIEAEVGSRMITAMVSLMEFIPIAAIQFLVNESRTFTIADVTALSLSPFVVKSTVVVAASVSLILLCRWLNKFKKSTEEFVELLRGSKELKLPILNPLLFRAIKKRGITILASKDIEVPCAGGLLEKYIIFPDLFMGHLSQEEFEAIVAHELDHLRWYDCSVRIVGELICTLFWWLPSKRWKLQLEQAQEHACDSNSAKFNIAPLNLASAIFKVSSWIKKGDLQLPVTHFVSPCFALKRVQAILREKKEENKWLKILVQVVTSAVWINAVFFGRFWIF